MPRITKLDLSDFSDVSGIPDFLPDKKVIQQDNVQVLIAKINEIIEVINKEGK